MGAAITLYLDVDVIAKLEEQGENRSSYLNALLRKHFNLPEKESQDDAPTGWIDPE